MEIDLNSLVQATKNDDAELQRIERLFMTTGQLGRQDIEQAGSIAEKIVNLMKQGKKFQKALRDLMKLND